MKNFPTDSLLKVFTTVCYVFVYGMAGYSVYIYVQMPKNPSTIPVESIQLTKNSEKNIQVVSTPSVIKNKEAQSQIISAPILVEPTITQAPVVDTRCIVAVDSVSYDVSQFKSTHSGGDVFNCGSDMTAIFYGQHNAEMLKKMSRYQI